MLEFSSDRKLFGANDYIVLLLGGLRVDTNVSV